MTITVNKEYLEKINESVAGGWFRKISSFANSVNLMTYDLHGPWSQSSDPYTSVHACLKQPETRHKDEFAINYAMDAITAQALSYGIPANKLKVGIAAYGRGFSGVAPGDDAQYPGFEQSWSGASHFSSAYTKQDGLLPYNSVHKLIRELNYKSYQIHALSGDNQSLVTGAYIYSPAARQFVGYQSPEVIKAVCEFVRVKQLQGAILWSADTDLPVSSPDSLVATYKKYCD